MGRGEYAYNIIQVCAIAKCMQLQRKRIGDAYMNHVSKEAPESAHVLRVSDVHQ